MSKKESPEKSQQIKTSSPKAQKHLDEGYWKKNVLKSMRNILQKVSIKNKLSAKENFKQTRNEYLQCLRQCLKVYKKTSNNIPSAGVVFNVSREKQKQNIALRTNY